jgi:hypothetical protein
VVYLYNLASSRLDNSISRLENITRVLIVNIVEEREEVIEGICYDKVSIAVVVKSLN